MTPDELRAVAYFAVGVTSEGSNAGRDVSYRLSFAGNVRNGVMDPVGNSGYSFGTLQIDLGQGNPHAFSGRQKWSYAASASFCIGVMPPSAMFGRSWLYVQSQRVAES